MSDQQKPHIPLSWLRKERKWAESAWRMNCVGSAYDTWRNSVDAEVARLTIAKLTTDRDALAAEVERLRAENSEWQRDWLAMMREIAKFADAMEPDDNEWCDADDATLLEQFDPWQTLRELAAVRAGSYQPVPDGVYPRPNWDGNGETILEVSYDGSELEEWHSSNPSDKEEIGLPDEPRIRLCQWQPAQDTQPTGERSSE